MHGGYPSAIYWRTRRGVLELDHIFLQFGQSHYAALNAEQQHAFTLLLDCPDPLLLAYLVYRTDRPKSGPLLDIVQIILRSINARI